MVQQMGPVIAGFMAFFVGLAGLAGTAFTTVTSTEMAGVVAVEEAPEIGSHVGGDVITYDAVGYSITVPEGWEAMSLPVEMGEDVGEMYFGVAGLYDGGTVIVFNQDENMLLVNVAFPVEPGDADTLKAVYDYYANEVMVPEQSETVQAGGMSVLMYRDVEDSVTAVSLTDDLMLIFSGYGLGDGFLEMLDTVASSIEFFEVER